MSWKCIFSSPEVVCYRKSKRGFAVQIEARQVQSGWKIYKTYFNSKGLSVCETFEAASKDDMERTISNLQGLTDPSLDELRNRMVAEKKEVVVHLQRCFKEYNVEKWQFAINEEEFYNFIYVRYTDTIEVDVMLHNRYQNNQHNIVAKALRVLGLQDEDDVDVAVYTITPDVA